MPLKEKTKSVFTTENNEETKKINITLAEFSEEMKKSNVREGEI